MKYKGSITSSLTALAVSCSLITTPVQANTISDNNKITNVSKETLKPIYEANNIKLNRTGYNITNELNSKLINNHSFSIVLSFEQYSNTGLQALFGFSNSKPGNNNSYLDVFVRDNGELGMEARDTSKKINNLVSRPASLWGKYNKKSVENTIALSVDAKTKTYSLYANGTKVAEEYMTNFLGIKDIQGIDTYMLGGVNRAGKLDFGFDGKVNQFKVFGNALSQNQLEELTSNSISNHLIYKANDETGSNYFRIPVLYTFSNGRVFSSIDARYGGTHDFLNKINIATSYSDDSGMTWREPKLTLAFDDFANVPLDWPRSPQMRDLQISGGATYIDSVIVEKDKKVFLFADVMPAGVSFRDATRSDSGYKDINGHTYLKLKKQGESGYNYTVREGGIIYDDRTNSPTDFRVNSDFSLSKNGSALRTEQYSVSFENNKKTEYKNGKMVNMNIFYKDALFKVVPTNYIAYITSSNFGDTWTPPKLLPPLMGLNRNAPYLGPGRGIVDSKTGRILISSYTGKESVFIYSDDNGLTWNQKTIPLPSSWSAEGQIVELSPGVLQTYMRTNNGKIAYITSYDSGNTWSKPQYLSFISNPSYGTELSIINYSQKIDGKNAVILSTPNSTAGRRHGQIWIGLINSNNTIDWKYHHDIDNSQYGYSYSTLTELPNHKIGVMFEKFDSWSRNELHMKNVVPYISFDIKDLMS
ncbi:MULTISPECIES: sialidase family protein [Lactobacillus]|uniref:sialidase family protein n=1 Tax=Lactobacillus TaxID=1578 RepID=UPI001CD4EEAB|nr:MULTISPECIES: exo-alpha-sialidase [Lactobacillus]MCW8124271.1 exo-alpha-sialidase [Lactobacillus mulieris]MCZ9599369.1 exo-alpha-sialidase [Lactobacillus mulieris]MDK7327486.1 exo-alpha-sialidase [Lactobacillus mulieris]